MFIKTDFGILGVLGIIKENPETPNIWAGTNCIIIKKKFIVPSPLEEQTITMTVLRNHINPRKVPVRVARHLKIYPFDTNVESGLTIPVIAKNPIVKLQKFLIAEYAEIPSPKELMAITTAMRPLTIISSPTKIATIIGTPEDMVRSIVDITKKLNFLEDYRE